MQFAPSTLNVWLDVVQVVPLILPSASPFAQFGGVTTVHEQVHASGASVVTTTSARSRPLVHDDERPVVYAVAFQPAANSAAHGGAGASGVSAASEPPGPGSGGTDPLPPSMTLLGPPSGARASSSAPM